jgi:hypothetical protein
MHLGGTTIPTSIEQSGGHYRIDRERLRQNGEGEAVVSGYYTLTWTFPQMSLSDFTWIASTLLGGAASVKYTSAQLYNKLGTLTTYTNAVAHEPTWETARGGYLENVTWVIDRIR